MGSLFCLLTCVSVFVQVLYCFGYCSFVEFEIKVCDISSFALFSQDLFGQTVYFVFPYKIRIIYSTSVANAFVILIEITLNLYVALSNMVILALILQIHEHSIPFHLCNLTFISVLQSLEYNFFYHFGSIFA